MTSCGTVRRAKATGLNRNIDGNWWNCDQPGHESQACTQAAFLSVAILQQAYFVFGAGSLDYPAEFLDGYFTRVALMQVFQIWAVLGFGSGLYALFAEVALRTERPDSLSAGLVEAK